MALELRSGVLEEDFSLAVDSNLVSVLSLLQLTARGCAYKTSLSAGFSHHMKDGGETPKKSNAQHSLSQNDNNPANLFIIFTESNLLWMSAHIVQILSMSFEPLSGPYHCQNGTLVDIHGNNRTDEDST
jgi:hypothetical protein